MSERAIESSANAFSPARPVSEPRHEWDDDGCCIHCGYDGAEAHYYSERGYAHEYEGGHICHKAPAS